MPLIELDKFLKVLALDMDCSVLGLVEVLKRSSIGLTLMRVRFGGLFWKGLSISGGFSEAWCDISNSRGESGGWLGVISESAKGFFAMLD